MSGIFSGRQVLAGVATAMLLAVPAQATTFAVFDGIAAGVTTFDGTVTSAGATVTSDVWTNLSVSNSIDRGDYTITRNDGSYMFPTTYGDMSGQVLRIDPDGGGSNPRTDPDDYFDSGFTLTFDNKVNAVGFEVGDWATCCFEPTTDLFMSFDGGAPILVASAEQRSQGEFPSQDDPSDLVPEIFIAAFDDSGAFNSLSFWGNGIDEVLVAGGQVRYALIDQGTLPPAPIPLPAGLPLLAAGMGALALAKRRKKNKA